METIKNLQKTLGGTCKSEYNRIDLTLSVANCNHPRYIQAHEVNTTSNLIYQESWIMISIKYLCLIYHGLQTRFKKLSCRPHDQNGLRSNLIHHGSKPPKPIMPPIAHARSRRFPMAPANDRCWMYPNALINDTLASPELNWQCEFWRRNGRSWLGEISDPIWITW